MVGPARKREAVTHLEEVLEVSERRACGVITERRSTQRYRGRKRERDAALCAELRRLSAAHPRAGYRMATALLRRAGMEISTPSGCSGSGGRKGCACRAGSASGCGWAAARTARSG